MSPVQFGHTWWGRAWVDAIEGGASLEANRLPRGRTYARQDRVTSLALEPGVVTASVRGSRRLNYRTHIAVRTYTDAEWTAVIGTIAGRAGHVAAALDGELEPGIVEDARSVGVEVFPAKGDLRPRCSCPDDARTCKHVAAVAYLVAEALDDDPFLVFTLRGQPRGEFLDALRQARDQARPAFASTDPSLDQFTAAIAPAEQAGPDPGEVARSAWERTRVVLPLLAELPPAPGAPAAWPEDPPPSAPFDAAGLTMLATDAARRAWNQLRGDGTSGLGLKLDDDIARRDASVAATGSGAADGSPGVPVDLTARAWAWHHGGEDGVAMVGEPAWRPPVATMAAARAALVEAGVSSTVLTVSNNRITGPGFQVRLSRSGAWWRFEKRKNRWEIAAASAEAPDDLLAPR